MCKAPFPKVPSLSTIWDYRLVSESHLQDLHPVQLDTEAVKLALEHDGEFFINFFLGEELSLPVPEFHVDIFADMTNVNYEQVAEAIPRDHAKTTLARMAAVWHYLFTPFRFVLYMSSTHSLAVPSTNAIIAFMESENFKAVFGELEWFKRQEGVGHYEFRLGDKYCILKAFGGGQSVRGLNIDNQRPQLGVIDDLEDDKAIATFDLYVQLKRWLYGPFFKCFDNKNKIKKIWLGNLIDRNSNLWDICQSTTWHVRRYGSLKANGEPLWPDAWSKEKLKADYLTYEEAGMADVWFAEMMNMPIATGGAVIAANEIQYRGCPLPEDCDYAFATVDLALSDKAWANSTVVTVHVMYEGYAQAAAQYSWKGLDPIGLFWELVRITRLWQIACVGIEDVAYQASLQYIYPHLCRVHGVEDIIFVPLAAVGKKAARIISWAGLIKAGEYLFTHGDMAMTEEILNYEPKKKDNVDDRIDSAAYYSQMIDRYMSEILSSRTFEHQNGKVISTFQNCAV